ncbi:MAG: hypothetical protein IH831_00380 [Planctomycetes bacterium]|nr:hypothetical protein [Planctomycetota bacterium]
MILRDVVDRLESKSPICVMAKAAMENVLSAERLTWCDLPRREHRAVIRHVLA